MTNPSAAIVTGASSGMGVEYAKLLAKDGHGLVLVARREGRLAALASEIEKAYRVQARVVAADLAVPAGISRVVDEVKRLGLEVEFLVNDAGFAASGPFAESDLEHLLDLVRVNVVALLTLTRSFLPDMISRGRGRILNVGSTAGFVPGPYMAVYYASKAFVNSFTEALWYELRGTGVTVTVSCPGATATEFAAVAGNERSLLFRLGAADAVEVAREGYRAMMRGDPLVVHGLRNKLLLQSLRLSPRRTIRAVAAALNPAPAARG